MAQGDPPRKIIGYDSVSNNTSYTPKTFTASNIDGWEYNGPTIASLKSDDSFKDYISKLEPAVFRPLSDGSYHYDHYTVGIDLSKGNYDYSIDDHAIIDKNTGKVYKLDNIDGILELLRLLNR